MEYQGAPPFILLIFVTVNNTYSMERRKSTDSILSEFWEEPRINDIASTSTNSILSARINDIASTCTHVHVALSFPRLLSALRNLGTS